MNPEILLAGSIGALFVFFLGGLRDYVRRRREREGLMTLIWTELLHNYVVLRRWGETIRFINAGEVKSFRTEIWAESRVRLAQLLPPEEFSKVSIYYNTIQEIQVQEVAGILLIREREAGYAVHRNDLEDVQNLLWPIASRYSKARHGKIRRWLRI